MKRLGRTFGAFLCLLVIATACKKDNKENLKREDLLNVSYGTHSRNVADVYLPDQRDASTPVILLVHGGSWFEGDKAIFTDLAKYLRDRGYAAASINYRLTNTPENNVHPAQVNDIGKAIEFISSKAGTWNISGTKFALLGASAGGHLSLLYSYAYNTNDKVKAVVSMAGPTDLTAIQSGNQQQAQVVQWLIGSTYQANPSAYSQASPITHVGNRSVPTMMFHGKLDVVVPYHQSVALNDKLGQSGVAKKLVLYENTGHEVLSLENTAAFLLDCENWFKQYLK